MTTNIRIDAGSSCLADTRGNALTSGLLYSFESTCCHGATAAVVKVQVSTQHKYQRNMGFIVVLTTESKASQCPLCHSPWI